MNLNESIRSAFVKRVLNDVPQEDYMEQARSLIASEFKEKIPPALRSHEAWLRLADHTFFHSDKSATDLDYYSSKINVSVYLRRGDEPKLFASTQKALDALLERHHDQQKKMRDLRTKLEGAIASYRTVKSAREGMPEFAKYLPEPTPKSSYLPAITGLKEDLEALGWPKSKTEEAVAA